MPRRRGIDPDPDWEQHKAELEWLYRGNTLKEVKAHMEETYRFFRTDSQYLTQFKKWNLKKRVDGDDWKFVHQRLVKRELDGKERSDVYKNGSLVPEEKVRKELSRHVPLSFHYTCGAEPSTPEGISIRTPAADADSCDPGPQTSDSISVHTPSAIGSGFPLWLNNLSCFQFQNLLLDHFRVDTRSGPDPGYFTGPFPAGYVPPPVDASLGDIVGLSPPTLDNLSASNFDYSLLQNEETNLDGCPASETIDCNAQTHADVDMVSEDSLREARVLLSDCLEGRGRTRIFPAGDNVDDIAFSLEPVMIERTNGDLTRGARKLFGSSKSDALFHFLQFCVYLSSNNLMSDAQTQRLLHWLTANGFRYMLKDMLQSNSTTFEVFASNLLRIAVKQEDIETTWILIKAGVETDAPSGLVIKRTALQEAVEMENVHLVQMLLDAGANPNAAGGGNTPLSCAFYNQQTLDLVRMLLNAGADPNPPQDPAKPTPLQRAVQSRKLNVVRLLLDAKANPNPPASKYFTPLQLACMHSDTELVEMLVLAGADVDATSDPDYKSKSEESDDFSRSADESQFARSYRTPIQLAAEEENWEAVQILLEAGAGINLSLSTRSKTELVQSMNENEWHIITVFSPLQAAVLAENLTMKGADVNAPAGPLYGCTALQAAATDPGGTGLLTLLIESGANVNSPAGADQGRTALQAAALAVNIEAVNILIDAGADVNACPSPRGGKTALQAAISARNNNNSSSSSSNKVDIVKALLKARADVNAAPAGYDGVMALQAAVKAGHLEITQLLLTAGANIDPLPDQSEYAPLIQAVRNQNIEMAALLLSKGANPNISPCGRGGRNPLQEAAWLKHISLVRLLLCWDADVNAPAYQLTGQTALQAAAKQGSLPAVKALFKAGGDINAPAALVGGETALQAAVLKGSTEVVRFLLNHGATLSLSDDEAKTRILSLAVKSWRIEDDLIEMLIAAGADVNPSLVNKGEKLATKDPILQKIARRGNFNLVQKILTAGANTNIRSVANYGPVTALQAAVQSKNIDIVQALVDREADVNAPANEGGGHTALQGAVSTGNLDIIRLLLKNGADLNAPPSASHSRTALQEAASKGNILLTKHLIQHGANVNAPPARNGGVTALQGAAIAGNIRIVMMLLMAEADVNGAPAMVNGRTAIEGAAENGRLDTLHLLLNFHRDTEDLELKQKRAAKLAISNGHFAIARFIKAYRKH